MLFNYGQQTTTTIKENNINTVIPALPSLPSPLLPPSTPPPIAKVCSCIYICVCMIVGGVASHMKRENVENLSIKGHI